MQCYALGKVGLLTISFHALSILTNHKFTRIYLGRKHKTDVNSLIATIVVHKRLQNTNPIQISILMIKHNSINSSNKNKLTNQLETILF